MWILKSNRQKHLVYAILSAIILTIIFVLGLAAGMEFKDRQYGNKFDWLDLFATVLGGIIGQILQWLIIFSLWQK